jgi:hypothetical protein
MPELVILTNVSQLQCMQLVIWTASLPTVVRASFLLKQKDMSGRPSPLKSVPAEHDGRAIPILGSYLTSAHPNPTEAAPMNNSISRDAEGHIETCSCHMRVVKVNPLQWNVRPWSCQPSKNCQMDLCATCDTGSISASAAPLTIHLIAELQQLIPCL